MIDPESMQVIHHGQGSVVVLQNPSQVGSLGAGRGSQGRIAVMPGVKVTSHRFSPGLQQTSQVGIAGVQSTQSEPPPQYSWTCQRPQPVPGTASTQTSMVANVSEQRTEEGVQQSSQVTLLSVSQR